MKNIKNSFLIIFSLFMSSFATAQTKIGDVVLPNTETFGEYELILNGAGIREKFWINMYVGALYLPQKSSDAQAILKSDKPLAVRLHIVSKLITSKRMSDAVNDGFEKSTGGNTAPLKNRINKLEGFFSEEIHDDDVFDMTYQPEIGVVVYKNGEKLGVIEGKDFKEALFGIWLSKDPAEEDMKEAMLGI